ncbi:MAG: hypothetical protein XD74_1857 [Actinobacteria bacterium 66_15]|nr:MAG: hypothetical protein XD74_1857 [Actinobacteria bacterium 66_15]
MSAEEVQRVGIHPTPRVLRVLGDIPFAPWQCIAELVDNSIDAFAAVSASGGVGGLPDPKVAVSWSGPAVPTRDRTLEVGDNGPGMTLEQISNVARAGYTGRNPLDNLGLFGMGFNIATARLGNRTRVLSATADATEWIGIEIDFDELQASGDFMAPVIREPKILAGEHGTRVIVSDLKPGAYATLRDQEQQIRRQLERVYSPLLSTSAVAVEVQGKRLVTRPACVWADDRFVVRNGVQVPAIIRIEQALGEAYFDVVRNAYVAPLEADALAEKLAHGEELPEGIIMRQKMLRGWVGIQRYADPDDFGIDFVRNGRKILLSDKTLFFYENPITGTRSQEYPKELGSTVGGRIVGELHVDYLIPTYQKNDFDRQDDSWRETVDALRGAGPILPQARRGMGFSDENDSHIGRLVNAYRRADSGTKNLAIEPSLARQWAERFREGDSEYVPDRKWFEAAKEADRRKANKKAGDEGPVDSGGAASDNADDYGPGAVDGPPTVPPTTPDASPKKTTGFDELKEKSRQNISMSRRYFVGGNPAPFEVKTWELESGSILVDGDRRACAFFSQGYSCDFVFDPRHPGMTAFPAGPRELLGLYLAERFKIRDNLTDLGATFLEVYERNFSDSRIDRVGLQERALLLFNSLREKMVRHLEPVEADVIASVKMHAGDEELTVMALLEQPALLTKFQDAAPGAIQAIYSVPPRCLVRLVEAFPGRVLDGACLSTPYASISLGDPAATQRAKAESLDRVIGLMKDATWVLGEATASAGAYRQKEELSRCSHSISFLESELTE